MTSDDFRPTYQAMSDNFYQYNVLFSGVILDLPTLKSDIINERSVKFMVGFFDMTLFSFTNSTPFTIFDIEWLF